MIRPIAIPGRPIMKVPVLVALLSLALPASAHAAGLIEERTELPAVFHTLFGDSTHRLDALIVRPDDGIPHPLAIINHGAPHQAIDRQKALLEGMREQAREFARRGFVAVSFTRRGYGRSEGAYAEDVREAIHLMRDKPYVDGARIIGVGRSAGGFATVALTADPLPGLVAAISFAGGRGSDGPDSVCRPSALIDAFATFGKTSRTPMLWVYAENDHYFSPALAHGFFDAFTGAGGHAEMIVEKPFVEDGHTLFSRDGIRIWTKLVDAFLAKQGLKQRDDLLPLKEVANAPEGLSQSSKDDFVRYLEAKPHKAFVISQDGHYG